MAYKLSSRELDARITADSGRNYHVREVERGWSLAGQDVPLVLRVRRLDNSLGAVLFVMNVGFDYEILFTTRKAKRKRRNGFIEDLESFEDAIKGFYHTAHFSVPDAPHLEVLDHLKCVIANDAFDSLGSKAPAARALGVHLTSLQYILDNDKRLAKSGDFETVAIRMGKLRGMLDGFESERILCAYERCGGNITRTSEFLDIGRSSLQYRIKKLGLPLSGSGSDRHSNAG